MPSKPFKFFKPAKKVTKRKGEQRKSSGEKLVDKPSVIQQIKEEMLADTRTWIMTPNDRIFNALGVHNFKIILRIQYASKHEGTDWCTEKGVVFLEKIFPKEYHPVWLNEETGEFKGYGNPQFWRSSVLDWIHIFAEYGADKATALMYIKFHVDERIAGRGSEEQKQYVGKEVPGMTSWDMVAAFHNFKTVKKNPGCILPGSYEEAQIIENGHKVENPIDMTSMVDQVAELEKLIKQNQSFEDAFKQMKLQ